MPYLLLTLAALFWGGNYVVGHVLVQGVDPILMTEARWALTALLLGQLLLTVVFVVPVLVIEDAVFHARPEIAVGAVFVAGHTRVVFGDDGFADI